MTYVVTGPCMGCKCGRCAEACPVQAFREGEIMLYIDPDACIECEACRFECERGAIFPAEDVPEAWRAYIALNAEESPSCPPISESQPPLGFPEWESHHKAWLNRESVA